MFEVHQLPVWQDNVVWLLVDRPLGFAAAVDGPEAGPVLERCEALGVSLQAILNTHTHPDHIGINLELESRGDLDRLEVYGAAGAAPPVPGLNRPVDDGATFSLAGRPAQVFLTEGHMNRHLSFLIEDHLFCGDTLFAGGCGYLFDGPAAKMHDSLSRLAALQGHVKVCCAHEYTQDNLRFAWSVEPGNAQLAERIRRVWALRAENRSTLPSTIEEERATNPFLRTESEEIQASLRRAMPEARLDRPLEVFTALRALKDQKHYRRLSDSALPQATE